MRDVTIHRSLSRCGWSVGAARVARSVLIASVQEPFEVAGKTITPQNLYTGLFVIGKSGVATLPSSATRLNHVLFLPIRHPHALDRCAFVYRVLDRRIFGLCRRSPRGTDGAGN